MSTGTPTATPTETLVWSMTAHEVGVALLAICAAGVGVTLVLTALVALMRD